MTFVAIAEIRDRIVGPLVCFCEQHTVAIFFVYVLAKVSECSVSFRQVFGIGSFAFEQIGDRVQAEAIDSHIEPEVDGCEHSFADFRIGPVQIGLMRIESMPIVGLRNLIPGPVRGFEVLKDDAGVTIFVRRVTPDIKVPPWTTRRSMS